MIILTRYEIKLNPKTEFFIMSKESPHCPLCSGELSGYDSRKRKVRDSLGNHQLFLLRRLKCKSCGKLHIELPSIIQPFKHYLSEVVEACLDGTRDDCPADDSTIRCWRKQWRNNLVQLEGALKSLWSHKYQRNYPLLAADSLLSIIQKHGSGWLTTVTQMVVAAGYGVPTQFAFCP